MTRQRVGRLLGILRHLHNLQNGPLGRLKGGALIRLDELAANHNISPSTTDRDVRTLRSMGLLSWRLVVRDRGSHLRLYNLTAQGVAVLGDVLPMPVKPASEAPLEPESKERLSIDLKQQKEKQAQGLISIHAFEAELKAETVLQDFARHLPDDQRGFLRLAMRRYGAAKTRIALDVAADRAVNGGAAGMMRLAWFMLRQTHRAAA